MLIIDYDISLLLMEASAAQTETETAEVAPPEPQESSVTVSDSNPASSNTLSNEQVKLTEDEIKIDVDDPNLRALMLQPVMPRNHNQRREQRE